MAPQSTEAEALKLFKESIVAKGKFDETRHNDFLLYRFLRARKYDLTKTELMFFECEDWRKNANVENIVQTYAYPEKEKVFHYYPRFYHKTDKLGRTVYVEQLKNLDVPALFQITSQDRLVTHHIREFEKFTRYRLAACSAKAGKNIEQGLSILDLKGVPLSQFNSVRKVIQAISSIASNYYPETMGKMFIINSPTIFTAVWAVLKTMLDENTVAKISILGSNYQKQLLELVEEKNLPKFLGGACECSGGCERSDTGPWNDGTVPGFPQPFWEDFSLRDKGAMEPEVAKNTSPQ